jgi:hypothetical protein
MYLKISKDKNIIEKIDESINGETGFYFIKVKDPSIYKPYHKYDKVSITLKKSLEKNEKYFYTKEKLEEQLVNIKKSNNNKQITKLENQLKTEKNKDRKQKISERISTIKERIKKNTERIKDIESKIKTNPVFPVMRKESDIEVTHSITQEQAGEIDNLLHNYKTDQETYKLIKKWCSIQAEGCEEAFLFMSKSSQRYKDYDAKKKEIIDSQKTKKKTLTTGVTLEHISDFI